MKENMRAIRRSNRERVIKKRFKIYKDKYAFYTDEDRYLKDLVVGKYGKNHVFGSCSCSVCRTSREFGYLSMQEKKINMTFDEEIKFLKKK